MSVAALPSVEPLRDADMERRLERGTWGQVRALRVEHSDERIVVHGWAASYYAVQLVVSKLLHELETAGSHKPIDLDIQVGHSPRLHRPGWNAD